MTISVIDTTKPETKEPSVTYFGQDRHDVFRERNGDTERLPLEPSLKLADHSPTGYSWGGLGSGCAQLALALLLDATGDKDKALAYYQYFKQEYVAGFEREWTLAQSVILEWMDLMECTQGVGS